MYSVIKAIAIVLLLMICSQGIFAQIILPEAAVSEIESRGLSQDEVKQRMSEKGVNLNTVNPNDPAERAKVEAVFIETLDELEAKKLEQADNQEQEEIIEEKSEEISDEIATQSEEIKDAVEDGASLEEAVSEAIDDVDEDVPPLLDVYGKHIFRDNKLKFYRTSENAKAPANYILGAGDKIIINIWGSSEESSSFEISDEGYIKPSRLPRIFLSGLSVSQAKKKLQNYYARYYNFRSEDFEVTLNVARTINVNIYGEVENVGTYNVSAINSALNALVAADGINDIGTVRKIKLIRGGQTKTLDVYKYLNNPSQKLNFYLQENDIIHVPVAGKIVAIEGAVKRPSRYELINNEGLIELIDFAGGLTDRAIQKNIQITRIENDEEKVIDINLRELKKSRHNYQLKSGDLIRINKIPNEFQNRITLNGAVISPGVYAYTPNMKLRDLLLKTEFTTDARLDTGYIARLNKDKVTVSYLSINIQEALAQPQSSSNVKLKPGDKVSIFRLGFFKDELDVSVEGRVRSPGSFRFDKSGTLRISDLILMAGGLHDDAIETAYLHRRNYTNPEEKSYVPVDVIRITSNPASSENFTLRGGDRLVIFSTSKFSDQYNVEISGAVREPKEVRFDRSLRLSDLINLAGGTRADAVDYAFIFRKDPSQPERRIYKRVDLNEINNSPNSENNLLQGGDKVLIFSSLTYIEDLTVSLTGAVHRPDTFKYDISLKIDDLLALSGGLKFEASPSRIDVYRVEFGKERKSKILAATLKINEDGSINTPADFILQPYDRIIVRKAPEYELQRVVKVNGEVRYPGQYVILHDNEKLSSIIERAGGLTDEAFLGGITFKRKEIGFVIVDAGEAVSNNNSEQNLIMQKGDVIKIPKIQNLITIVGHTRASELYPDTLILNNSFTVPFEKGKDANYYIKKYAAGIGVNSKPKLVSVRYPSGETKRTSKFLFFNNYPGVPAGSEIRVGYKLPENKKLTENKEPTDWNKIIGNTIAQATSVLTLILLLQRID